MPEQHHMEQVILVNTEACGPLVCSAPASLCPLLEGPGEAEVTVSLTQWTALVQQPSEPPGAQGARQGEQRAGTSQ